MDVSRPDVVVIGAGFAGLSAAVHLAAQGVEVSLLEQESVPGGKAGEVRVDGFRFDTGPSVFTLPHVFEDVFRAAGRSNPVKLEPLDLLTRYEFSSGRAWDVQRDVGSTAAQLGADERDAYVRLLAEARRLFEASAPTFVYGPPPGGGDLVRYGLRHGLRAHPFRGLPALVRAGGARGDLEAFFLRFATYFGADPFRAPAVLHNIAWVELGLGVRHPRGGIHGTVRALADLARDLGVEVRTRTEVRTLVSKDGRVRRVVADGTAYEPRFVISAVDRARTLGWLGRPVPAGSGSSLSGFVLLLGIVGRQPRLAQHTVFFPANYRSEFEAIGRGDMPIDPTLYVHVSSRREAGDAPAGGENWFVMANAPSLAVGADPEALRDREAEYAGLIERRLGRLGLLDGVEVRVRRWLGPSDLSRHGHRGAIYGAAPHSLLGTLRPGPKVAGVANLALAGGTVHPGGGIPLALLSGRNAARVALEALGHARGARELRDVER